MAEEHDLVAETFENLRRTAKKRNGTVPDLRRQGRNVVPKRALGRLTDESADDGIRVPGIKLEDSEDSGGLKKARYYGPGRLSGPDGRAPRRSYQVKGFGDVLKREVRNRDWAKPLALGWVMGRWDELVGEKIAQHTTVEMVKESTLFISTDTTAWASQLKMMKPQILRNIADKIGAGVITDLHVYPPKTKSWRYGPLHVKGRGPRDTYG
ncbi:DciA family protein [Corynebacterium lubricantis]|uniref:DciA family protein n=1 Tax=Corynebacterium lubricantis TaxID=541095 RepID=UPI0003764DE8|nr:DciA family protein [Corynebacterium lubricantis]